MHAKLLILTLALYLQVGAILAQRQWVSPDTTAQEMRNPWTWYRPYYQAAQEAYSKFYQNARDITAQLYMHGYMTGAWGGGNSGGGGGAGGGGGGNMPPVQPNPQQNWG